MQGIIQKKIQQDFTLRKSERLKSRKQIDMLFKKGKSFSHFPFRVLYAEAPADSSNLRVAFSVSKKNFKKAVDRNKVKRLMREAYRLQKPAIKKILTDSNKNISLFFIYTDKRIPQFKEMMEKMNVVLGRLAKMLS